MIRAINPAWGLVAPLFLLVVALYAVPILDILRLSVTEPQFGVANYTRLLEGGTVTRVIWTTVRISFVTTLIAVCLGYVIAYVMVHALEDERRWMLAVLLMSFWISVLVRTFSWLMLLGRNGLVNSALISTGLIDEPLALIRNELGVIIGIVQYMIPYAVLPLMANMQGIDRRVLVASRGLGASRWQTFMRIYLPLTRPGIIAAFLLVFITCLGFYVTPAVLGGGRVLMAAEFISVQVLITVRWGTAAMLATLMLISVLALMYLLNRFVKLSAIFGGGPR